MSRRTDSSAPANVTNEHRINRVLNRLSRDRVLTRTQIMHVRGTNDLITLLEERGWVERLPADVDPRVDQFALTPVGAAAREERRRAGNFATC